MEETKQTNTPEEYKAKPRGISLYDIDEIDLERWAKQKQKTSRRKVGTSEIVRDLIEERRKKEQGKK